MIIAIDGPAGTGKGTVAKMISERLGYTYIDTGAMYRCIALKVFRDNIELTDMDSINKLLGEINIFLSENQKVFLNGEDVSELIRKPNVNEIVSQVSAIKEIRTKMVELQRKMGSTGNIVMEGRDITTVVFPNAEIKIYLDANVEIRARRRYEELIKKGNDVTYEETLESVKRRDKNDTEKPIGALKVAEDAVIIDSSYITAEEVYQKVYDIIKEKQND